MGGSAVVTIGIAILIIVLVILFFTFIPVGLWITAYFSGVKIGIGTLIGMRLRRVVPPSRIVNPMIKATKAGLTIGGVDKLEAHYLAGGKCKYPCRRFNCSPKG